MKFASAHCTAILQPGGFHDQPLRAVLAFHCDRTAIKFEIDAHRLVAARLLGKVSQMRHHLAVPRLKGGIVGNRRQIGGPQHRLRAHQMAKLPGFLGGKAGLMRPAPADNMHIAHGATAQHAQRMVGDIGARQLLGGLGQDARTINRHIAVADDRRAMVRQVHRQPGMIGMAIVPAHKRR